MGIYNELPTDLNEVDIIIAGGMETWTLAWIDS